MKFFDLFDTYSRQARLQPALFVLFPLFITIAIWLRPLYDMAASLVGLAVACGAIIFLAHLSRSFGRKVETRLFAEWGGKPTTTWLLHNDCNLDAHTKARYRAFFTNHVPDWTAPSQEDESTDYDAVSAAYDSAVRWLREATRDRSKFDLVFRENVSYGFRRNLYGLKMLGLVVSITCVAGNIGALCYDYFSTFSKIEPAGLVSLVISVVITVGWFVIVRQTWVRDSADSYTRALLAACDQLGLK